MPFFNPFQKNKKVAEARLQPKEAELPREKKLVKDPSGVILRPHVSEKASQSQENNEYVFEVLSSATKLIVRDAVKRTYGVDASKVRIINVKPRKVRLGRFQGTKPGFKKAIIKLKIGQKIDSLSV
ncbi:MAG: large subunit ribosomal protein L23 [Parcubacteria group bacterium Greene0714_21]|nr:MAG: large subunit ribosomal protein L23 [Parcubacteria group bacterium Greene0416_39]TSC97698.1 MAG: large subunit ribosomal protein L23 [Parcubacteria group bacterium Greene1014_47]TSD04378.1 MAG: large subunit ribosomal protein L23 [Parcubacteria group bacterium Greene0714_21]